MCRLVMNLTTRTVCNEVGVSVNTFVVRFLKLLPNDEAKRLYFKLSDY
jgi:hypothetical protein